MFPIFLYQVQGSNTSTNSVESFATALANSHSRALWSFPYVAVMQTVLVFMRMNSSLPMTITKLRRKKAMSSPSNDLGKYRIWNRIMCNSHKQWLLLSLTSHEYPTYSGNFAPLDFFFSSYILPTNPSLFTPHGWSPTRLPMPSSGQCSSMKLSHLPSHKLTSPPCPRLWALPGALTSLPLRSWGLGSSSKPMFP